jgi:hypothetical protein
MKTILSIWALALFLAGCITLYSDPVTRQHWDQCITLCDKHGVLEACIGVKGHGCKCGDKKVIWFDWEFED